MGYRVEFWGGTIKLLVDTLTTTIEQTFYLKNDTRYILEEIKPYLYFHNAPAGTFTLTLLRGSTEITSKSFTTNDVKTALNTTDNYFHLFYPVQFDSFLPLEKGTYKLRLSSSGYVFSGSSYIAWVKEFESIYQEFENDISVVTDYPYSFRLIINNNRELAWL